MDDVGDIGRCCNTTSVHTISVRVGRCCNTISVRVERCCNTTSLLHGGFLGLKFCKTTQIQ